MTKPFKVGERVRVYETDIGFDGGIEESFWCGEIERVKGNTLSIDGNWFHFKQCRRLRKKKRRRVFVQAAFLKEHPNLTPLLNWCVDSPIVTTSSHGSLKPPGDWVEFIEAKEKKK